MKSTFILLVVAMLLNSLDAVAARSLDYSTGRFIESPKDDGTTYYYNTYAINAEGISYGMASLVSTVSTSTFTGTAGWNSDANWSTGIPLTGGTAIIEGNPTISTANITLDNLMINSGLVLVNNGIKLTIVQTLNMKKSNGASIIIE